MDGFYGDVSDIFKLGIITFMYENRYIRPISFLKFLFRMLAHSGISILLLVFSLLIGMVGFIYTENMAILDAFLNSSMLLGGMGPIKTVGLSESGKLFSGIYALYTGLVLIAVMSIMISPVVHRIMHRIHWGDTSDDEPVS